MQSNSMEVCAAGVHTQVGVVLCRPGLKAVSRPEWATDSRAVSKPQLWLDRA